MPVTDGRIPRSLLHSRPPPTIYFIAPFNFLGLLVPAAAQHHRKMLAPRLTSRSSSLQSAGVRCCHLRAGSISSRHGSTVVAAARKAGAAAGRPPRRNKRDRAEAESSAVALARTITEMITSCQSITELSDVCETWSGSFDHRHNTTAFIKAAQLAEFPIHTLDDFEPYKLHLRAARATVDRLAALWAEQLPAAGPAELATVLWLCSQLHRECIYTSSTSSLWSSTVAAYMRRHRGKAAAQEYSNVLRALGSIGVDNEALPGLTKQEVTSVFKKLTRKVLVMAAAPAAPDVSFQVISDTLWAHANLLIQPAPADLRGLLEAAVQPQLLDAATARGLGDVIGTVMRLAELAELDGGKIRVPKVVWEKLLAEPQLQKLRLSPGESTRSVVRRARHRL